MGDQENGESDSMLKSATNAAVKKNEMASSKTDHKRNMKKFAIACLVLQSVFAVIYLVMARYDVSADARHWKDGILKGIDGGENKEHIKEDLKKNLEKYPLVLDVNMMLIGGFGFLMAFVRRFTFSAVGLTFICVTFVTEWTILLEGFKKIGQGENEEHGFDGPSYTFPVTFHSILNGGFGAAAVMISVGGVLGKLNPFQILVMSVIEAAMFVLSCFIGYDILGVVDVGGAIYIHAFGAYFGLAVAMMSRKRDVEKSAHMEASRYTSDIFSLVGTVLLWIYWPSFNAALASGDAQHRAVINTYISLCASTLATFIVSSLFGEKNRFQVVDIQNATLSGGVAVGAIADLMLQPGGAFVMGSVTGAISAFGYRILQGKLFDKMKLHDTCGINNLHGMPGIISALASAVMCGIATKDMYGESFSVLFPEVGDERSVALQAGFQILGLVVTLFIAIVTGAATGFFLNNAKIFEPMTDYELFDDAHFWTLPDESPKRDLNETTAVEMTMLENDK